jgi:ABC-type lipoprotein export system ATPase subunit
MAAYRAWRSTAHVWGALSRGDGRESAWKVCESIARFALIVEPLRCARRTYRALLQRELATAVGSDLIRKLMRADALCAHGDGRIVGASVADGAAAVGAPACARAAFDACADAIEACVGLLYHGHCLFASNMWAAPGLLAFAMIGESVRAKEREASEAKKEAHRAEGAATRLRELLTHARVHGEAIALANGAKTESEEAMATLEAGQEFVYRRQVLSARASYPTDVFAAACNFLPMVAVIPRLIRGENVSIWSIQVAMTSFNGVRAALAMLSGNVETLRAAEAHAAYVDGVYDELDTVSRRAMYDSLAGIRTESILAVDTKTSADGEERSSTNGVLVQVSDLSVCLPQNGRELVRALEFEIRRGDSLAIVGDAGCGKTALVKSFIGLWSWGHGTTRIVDRASVCVLSKKPYMPQGGTLLDACTYPTPSLDIGLESRELVKVILVELGLAKYLERLDTFAAWNERLTLDEQQRIAMCRAAVSRAELCVLDDATSSMSDANRTKSYDILNQYVGAVLSLGDEREIARYHTRVIRIKNTGSWVVVDAARVEPTPSTFAESNTTAGSGSFNPLGNVADTKKTENQFMRRQKKSVARVLGVDPIKFGVVPTPTKEQRTLTKTLSFDPLKASPARSLSKDR